MIAELIINWESSTKGFLNHWTRLALITFILLLDFYLYLYQRSASTSYWAHIGGMLVGSIAGSLVLENLEVTDFERFYMLPGLKGLGAFLTVGCVLLYALYFPPMRLELRPVEKPRCCMQLLACPGVHPEDYHWFQCIDAIHVRGGYNIRETCDSFEHYVTKMHEIDDYPFDLVDDF